MLRLPAVVVALCIVFGGLVPKRTDAQSFSVSIISVRIVWDVEVYENSVDEEYGCPRGWFRRSKKCYKVFNDKLKWSSARQNCRNNAGELANLSRRKLQKKVMKALHKACPSCSEKMWVGSYCDKKRCYLPSGKRFSKYKLYWDKSFRGLKYSRGCMLTNVYVSGKKRGKYRLASLASCDDENRFLCERRSCPSRTFLCRDGSKCIDVSWVCDGVKDCKDGSDERQRCEPSKPACGGELSTTSGTVTSPNYPNDYNNLAECFWTISTPAGHLITLDFTEFNTEFGYDQLEVFEGLSADKDNRVATYSGVRTGLKFTSDNNVLSLLFKSDASRARKGFSIAFNSAKPITTEEIQVSKTSATLIKSLAEVTFGLTYTWTIKSSTVVSFKFTSIDMGSDSTVRFFDGSISSTREIGNFTGRDLKTTRWIFSTTANLTIQFSVGFSRGANKFEGAAREGCDATFNEPYGVIESPGYNSGGYSNNIACHFTINPLNNKAWRIYAENIDLEIGKDKLTLNGAMELSAFNYMGIMDMYPDRAAGQAVQLVFTSDSSVTRRGFRLIYTPNCVTTISSTRYSRSRAMGCPTGYVMHRHESTLRVLNITCTLGGIFDPPIPLCYYKFCGSAPNVKNSYITHKSHAWYGGYFRYACKVGTRMVGNSRIDCGYNGWSVSPRCEDIKCSPPDISNITQLEIRGGKKDFKLGQSIRFRCKSKYELHGPLRAYCGYSGTFSALPMCKPIGCRLKHMSFFGKFLVTGDKVLANTAVTFQCRKGFKVRGTSKDTVEVRCLPSGSFNMKSVQCVDINECQENPKICGDMQCNNHFGSYQCACKPGYRYSKKDYTTCVDIDECKEKRDRCNGICHNIPGGYNCSCPIGSKLYTKDEDAWVVANIRQRQRRDLEMDRTCIPLVCPYVTQKKGYKVYYQRSMSSIYKDHAPPVLSRVILKAQPGYYYGNGMSYFMSTCVPYNNTMIWYPTLPAINRSECPSMDVKNGIINATSKIYGSVGKLQCNPGFKLKGSDNAKCSVGGNTKGNLQYKWNTEGKCVAISSCPDLTNIPNGEVFYKKDFGSLAAYQCNPGFIIIGHGVRYCQRNGQWTSTTPSCKAVTCPLPTGSPYARLVSSSATGWRIGSQANYTCALDGFKFTNKNENMDEVLCVPKDHFKSIVPYKLQTHYICPGRSEQIGCPFGTRKHIVRALYGYQFFMPKNCPGAVYPTKPCGSSKVTTEIIRHLCHGQPSCWIPAQAELFGGGSSGFCEGKTAILEVNYVCIPGPPPPAPVPKGHMHFSMGMRYLESCRLSQNDTVITDIMDANDFRVDGYKCNRSDHQRRMDCFKMRLPFAVETPTDGMLGMYYGAMLKHMCNVTMNPIGQHVQIPLTPEVYQCSLCYKEYRKQSNFSDICGINTLSCFEKKCTSLISHDEVEHFVKLYYTACFSTQQMSMFGVHNLLMNVGIAPTLNRKYTGLNMTLYNAPHLVINMTQMSTNLTFNLTHQVILKNITILQFSEGLISNLQIDLYMDRSRSLVQKQVSYKYVKPRSDTHVAVLSAPLPIWGFNVRINIASKDNTTNATLPFSIMMNVAYESNVTPTSAKKDIVLPMRCYKCNNVKEQSECKELETCSKEKSMCRTKWQNHHKHGARILNAGCATQSACKDNKNDECKDHTKKNAKCTQCCNGTECNYYSDECPWDNKACRSKMALLTSNFTFQVRQEMYKSYCSVSLLTLLTMNKNQVTMGAMNEAIGMECKDLTMLSTSSIKYVHRANMTRNDMQFEIIMRYSYSAQKMSDCIPIVITRLKNNFMKMEKNFMNALSTVGLCSKLRVIPGYTGLSVSTKCPRFYYLNRDYCRPTLSVANTILDNVALNVWAMPGLQFPLFGNNSDLLRQIPSTDFIRGGVHFYFAGTARMESGPVWSTPHRFRSLRIWINSLSATVKDIRVYGRTTTNTDRSSTMLMGSYAETFYPFVELQLDHSPVYHMMMTFTIVNVKNMHLKEPLRMFGALAPLPLDTGMILISRNKPTKQNGTYQTSYASLAVDGNKASNFTQNSCTHTSTDQAGNWWEIDLWKKYRITKVVIYNRKLNPQRLSNFVVKVKTFNEKFEVCATYPGAARESEVITLSCNAVGEILRIELLSKNFLTLCEVEVFGYEGTYSGSEIRLLSENKTATQVDTLTDNTGFALGAMLAVDGNANSDITKKSCTSSRTSNAGNWWEVDLEKLYSLESVYIYNQRNNPARLTNFVVEVKPLNGTFTICASYPGTATESEVIILPCKAMGQIVRIRLLSANYLTLCEVVVYGTDVSVPAIQPTTPPMVASSVSLETIFSGSATARPNDNTNSKAAIVVNEASKVDTSGVLVGDKVTVQFEPIEVNALEPRVQDEDVTGEWSKPFPVCEDKEAPVFLNCPSNITVPMGKDGPGPVVFDMPTAIDNSGEVPTCISSRSDIMSPYVFEKTESITYTATDRAGNQANCTITFVVNMGAQFKCPNQNYIQLVNTAPNRMAPMVHAPLNIKGDSSELNITYNLPQGTTIPLGIPIQIEVVVKDKAGAMSNCVYTHTLKERACTQSNINIHPQNVTGLEFKGACKTVNNVTMCTLQCMRGYQFAGKEANATIDVTCDTLKPGWMPFRVPFCAKIKGSYDLEYTSNLTSRPQNPTCMTSKYSLDALSKRLSSQVQCTSGSAQLQVGASLAGSLAFGSTNFKFKVSIGFDAEVKSSSDVEKCAKTASDLLADSSVDITSSVRNCSMNSTALTRPSKEGFFCAPGQQKITETNIMYCAACQPGQHQPKNDSMCEDCSMGYFQDETMQTTCKPCAPKSSTRGNGTQSGTECMRFCRPGFYGDLGLEPCTMCPVGEYSTNEKSLNCTKCLGNTTTPTEGAMDMSQCQEPCRPGYYSKTGLAPCASCPRNTYQTNSSMTTCTMCPNATGTSGMGSMDPADCKADANPCEMIPCVNGTKTPIAKFACYCHCEPGFVGDDCSEDVDNCMSMPCLNGGKCIDGVNNYTCECEKGYEGQNCEMEMNLCSLGYCENNSTCIPTLDSYICLCKANYEGKNCSTKMNVCTNTRCLNNGTCTEDPTNPYGYSCNCSTAAGYEGAHCHIPMDPCRAQPCKSPTCKSMANGLLMGQSADQFECVCSPGWTGTTCEIDIDECLNETACLNNATCVNSDFGYSCECQEGFNGTRCETNIDDCSPNPCMHNGTCTDGVASYTCNCTEGFAGVQCEVKKDNCENNMCYSNGTLRCLNEINSYSCECLPGYNGTYCNETVTPCDPNPCLMNATCEEAAGDYVCECLSGYEGKNCDVDIDDCASRPCFFGNCTDQLNAFECSCFPGYNGTLCDEAIDQCADEPCQNNGTCSSVDGKFVCECEEGWTGPTCAVDIDDCGNNPCQNNGTCIDMLNDFECQCVYNFTGKNCSIAPDACRGNPCLNGGVCNTSATDPLMFNCTCATGYEGETCETNPDDCPPQNATFPCQNGGRCIDGLNSYTCRCPPSHTGEQCEKMKEIDFDLFFGRTTVRAERGLSMASVTLNTSIFTIAFWVRFAARGSTDDVLSLTKINMTDEMVVLSGGNLSLTYKTVTNNIQASLSIGVWVPVAIMFDSGRFSLYVRGTLAGSVTMAGWTKLDGNYRLTLGSENTRGSSFFEGLVSRTNMYSISITTAKWQVASQNVTLFDSQLGHGDLAAWGSFDLEVTGLVETKRPSTTGVPTACPPGYKGTNCATRIDKSPPTVVNCPAEGFTFETPQDSRMAKVNFTEPTFTDDIGIAGVNKSHTSGMLLTWGEYAVSFIAQDAGGNTASCEFSITVVPTICKIPDNPNPNEHTNVTCSVGTGEDEGVITCAVSCKDPSNYQFSEENVPPFYTCSGGVWSPPTTLQPFVFPSCQKFAEATSRFSVSVTYNAVGDCDNKKNKTKTAFVNKFRALHNSNGNICKKSDCTDLEMLITCPVSAGRRKRATKETGTTVVTLPPSSHTQLQSATKGSTFAVTGDGFNANQTVLAPNLVCSAGSVLQGTTCVECSAGTYQDQATNLCTPCPVGTYQNSTSATVCTNCSGSDTTPGVGAKSAAYCYTSCQAGYYFFTTNSTCLKCPVGMYSVEAGQAQCLACPNGQTSTDPGTGCKECVSGQQLNADGACEPCPKGMYRDASQASQTNCVPCPSKFTTATTGSTTAASCNIPLCQPGEYRKNNVCNKCQLGTYQPTADQTACIRCPAGQTTTAVGQTSQSSCQAGLVNECVQGTHNCNPRADCKDTPMAFTCTCKAPQWAGNGVQCACAPGWTGVNCDAQEIKRESVGTIVAIILGSICSAIGVFLIAALAFYCLRVQDAKDVSKGKVAEVSDTRSSKPIPVDNPEAPVELRATQPQEPQSSSSYRASQF